MWSKIYDCYMDYTSFLCRENGKVRKLHFGYNCTLFDTLFTYEENYKNNKKEYEFCYILIDEDSRFISRKNDWDLSKEFEKKIKDSDINFKIPINIIKEGASGDGS